MFEAFESFAEFATTAHGGDPDAGGAPAGEGADVGNGFLLEVEQAHDQLFARLEGGEEFVEELAAEAVATFAGGSLRCAEAVLEVGRFLDAEVAVGDELPAALTAEAVVAGVECDPRDPVLEGLAVGELVEAGKHLHEDPEIPNFGSPHQGPVLKEGMVFAIEPMVNMGRSPTKILDDGWTVVTEDGKPSAHFEHTIAIGKDGPEILTK